MLLLWLEAVAKYQKKNNNNIKDNLNQSTYNRFKIYNGDFFNNQVDLLAKEALNLSAVKIDYKKTDFILLLFCWNNIYIDISIRNFIKEIHKKSINFQ